MSQPVQMVKVTRRLATSAERVFDAWLDPTTVGKWLFSTPTGKMVRVEIDAQVGGRYVIVERRDVGDVEHTGEYIEIDRPRRIVFTFRVPLFSPESTRVSIDIVALSAISCEITLTHEGVFSEYADRTQEGWTTILSGLQSSVDGLKTLRMTRRLTSPPERVFDAWTDPKLAAKWLFTSPESEHHEMQTDARAGGKWTVVDRRGGVDYTAIGEYLEFNQPSHLVFTFGMPQFSPEFGLVTIEIEPTSEGSLMTLIHERLPPSAVSELEKGWGSMLDRLPEVL